MCACVKSWLYYDKQAYEKSEDPIYVLENNIPIDPQYYLDNQISKVSMTRFFLLINILILILILTVFNVSVLYQPLLRIFEPILKNASKELLHGAHTRSISVPTPSNSGIMKFAKKQLTCIGCKTPLRCSVVFLVSIVFTRYNSVSFLRRITPSSQHSP